MPSYTPNQQQPSYPNQPQQPQQYNQPQYQQPNNYNAYNQPQPPQQPYQAYPYYGQPVAPAKKGMPAWVLVVGGLVVVGILVGLLVATGVLKGSFSVTTGGAMRVNEVTLAKGYSNETAVNPTSVFSPGDNPLHSVVKLENPTAGARITGIWTAVDAGGEQNVEIGRKELTIQANSSNTAHFSVELNQDWPAGTYKFELLVNDKLEKTVNFTVQ